MSDEHKKILQQKLWDIANTLRSKMNADEFRNYILGFIFYKYLSENLHLYANELLEGEEIKEYTDLDATTELGQQYMAAIKKASIKKLGYFLKPSELLKELLKKANAKADDADENEVASSNFILEDLQNILDSIEASTKDTDSEDDFDNLFEDLDLTSSKLGKTPDDKNKIIVKVLVHLDKIDFRIKDTEVDVLGDAYEYLIGEFASGAGKKAGEFYTPQTVSTVLAKIVTIGKTKLKNIYDPTCGSGSLLLRVAKEVKEVSMYYGQESSPTTYNLARMNMILHDVHYDKFDIKHEDTLERPQHLDLVAEAIVANPPFSSEWSANQLHLSDDRFSNYGKLAPQKKADFAFVQHMIHHLSEDGTMAVVLPHGVLFRRAAEGHIRRYLVKDCNYLDAVIGLPPNIFYGTDIPTCILVFKKQREDSNNVLFIDASKGYQKAINQYILREQDISKIIKTYSERKTEAKYSCLASLDDIKENDYNLNIPRYLDTFEEEEPIDLSIVSEKLKALNDDIQKTNKIITSFSSELNLDTPF